MGRKGDTSTFNSAKYDETVRRMREARESVHDKGERIFRETGKLDPNADIKGKRRVSHNSMERDGERFVLKNGIALPIVGAFDGTGSMGSLVGKAFEAIPAMDKMFDVLRRRYNTQVASAVWQDVCDPHPVVQMTQFESDVRIAEQIRLLVPDHGGGDATEDYDLGLAYLMVGVDTDIFPFYGLKGYVSIVADEIGRGEVTQADVQEHLGQEWQKRMTTKAICAQLLTQWHIFYVQVAYGGELHSHTTKWWTEVLGTGRVVKVTDPEYLAEVQAGLIYVTETLQPTLEGLVEFLTVEGANKRITKAGVSQVWGWLQEAREHFGAQVKLPGYKSIPKPGDVFSDLRNPWPIGHPRSAENPVPDKPTTARLTPGKAVTPKTKKGGMDWGKF
ncbi:hypothetical protein M1116_02080 [Patescibacteria group bacterium]|nr:hypothetical protein [Patescibacteria group bacterium]